MVEELTVQYGLSKEDQYKALLPQIEALVAGESNLTANLGNICAALKTSFDFLWVGFYLVEGNELVLGPFQGPVACTRISYGKGVCGMAWEKNTVLNVPDVDKFPGHIACSSESQSEIVVPISKEEKVQMVLDIDSENANNFDEVDHRYLEALSEIIKSKLI